MFATGGQENGFVAQTQQCQGDDRRHHQNGIDQTDVTGAGGRPAMTGRQQRPHAGAQHYGIQADVDDGAGITSLVNGTSSGHGGAELSWAAANTGTRRSAARSAR